MSYTKLSFVTSEVIRSAEYRHPPHTEACGPHALADYAGWTMIGIGAESDCNHETLELAMTNCVVYKRYKKRQLNYQD
ncbi:hypothetical protein N7456_013559 [Penicillium angulare]|uniref:Uncharacterized protein n=1 Tax=Penicillium angulare TaxID=116970 RepID=A0A9W9JSF3_9EURO|nr:hypothetical protein N7456_013559 [Penicillium angulare]